MPTSNNTYFDTNPINLSTPRSTYLEQEIYFVKKHLWKATIYKWISGKPIINLQMLSIIQLDTSACRVCQ